MADFQFTPQPVQQITFATQEGDRIITAGPVQGPRGPQGPIGPIGPTPTLEDLGITATPTELNYTDGVTSPIQPQLNSKANTSHNHSSSDITDLEDYATTEELSTGLASKADSNHSHAIADTSGLQAELNDKANNSHNHDSRYYTESEVDTLLSDKSATSHNHALNDLTEKSYNSLTDKPTIPVVPSNLLESVVAGNNVTVDNTDPKNPVISTEGGVPDEPYEEYDLTNAFFDMFLGASISLGTNGGAVMRLTKIGRNVKGWLTVACDSDHEMGGVGPALIPGVNLPYAPLASSTVVAGAIPMAFPMGFGYATTSESSPGAGDGTMEVIGPAISYTPDATLLFVQTTGKLHDGALGNVWSANGNGGITHDYRGKQFAIHCQINYETDE